MKLPCQKYSFLQIFLKIIFERTIGRKIKIFCKSLEVFDNIFQTMCYNTYVKSLITVF